MTHEAKKVSKIEEIKHTIKFIRNHEKQIKFIKIQIPVNSPRLCKNTKNSPK